MSIKNQPVSEGAECEGRVSKMKCECGKLRAEVDARLVETSDEGDL